MAQDWITPICDFLALVVRFAPRHPEVEFIWISLCGFVPEDLEPLFLFIVVLCSKGVVLRVYLGDGPLQVRVGWFRQTLCFSKIPHFSRSRGCARSRWFLRCTALRMEDMTAALEGYE